MYAEERHIESVGVCSRPIAFLKKDSCSVLPASEFDLLPLCTQVNHSLELFRNAGKSSSRGLHSQKFFKPPSSSSLSSGLEF